MAEKSSREIDLVARRGTLRTVLVTLGLCGIGLIALYLLRSFATALLIIFAGILFGVFLHGVSMLLAKWLCLPRQFALALAVLLLMIVCSAFLWLAGPQIAQQTQLLIQQLPQSINALQQQLQRTDWGRAILGTLPSLDQLQPSFQSILGSVTQAFYITSELIGALVFVLFVGLYLAATPDAYIEGILRLFPHQHQVRAREVFAALGLALRWWLLGRAVTMTLMCIFTTIALRVAHIPLALVLGVIAGLLIFVPYLGAIVAAIPAMLIGLMEGPTKVLEVALIYTGVHVFEGYCITPFVQKRAVALPPALLLSVQILSAALFGALGIIFSTPLTVVAIVLVQTLYVQDMLGKKVALLGERNSHE